MSFYTENPRFFSHRNSQVTKPFILLTARGGRTCASAESCSAVSACIAGEESMFLGWPTQQSEKYCFAQVTSKENKEYAV
mmetsp:Transcript_9919/g.24738  ORF Transcript_9919/g.24738 Transcript_9919/m.24738 type:complete len:80 (-) Transcript_9919:55-294(-)